jgi:ABC-type multidrug transport system ATPase subunit
VHLRQNGKTILLTTHLLEEADQLCGFVSFIVNGQIVANDTPQNLKPPHGNQSLKVPPFDPHQPDLFSYLILSMDKVKNQQYLAELMA